MKPKRKVELLFCRIQKVKGRLKAKVFGIEGAVNLGKPLEKDECRVTVTPNWLDLYSYSEDSMYAKIAEIRLQRGFVDIRHVEPAKIVPATRLLSSKQKALKAAVGDLKAKGMLG